MTAIAAEAFGWNKLNYFLNVYQKGSFNLRKMEKLLKK